MTTDQWDASYEELLRGALPRLAEKETVSPDTSLKAVGLDSLAMVEVLALVENEYGITIPDDELVAGVFDTPGTLWTLVSALREQRTAGA
ncbi:acyl carrier protein [Streptomyces albidus (ex Kaewkla and Franco 2022)]|uniref:acyl carrier protein n=1 Tax=Streptomyces albidus (ex Kaewkla and Franco 2022) TaxID=722709 RepID=UPI001F3EAC22|nr:acyl carrier protein [Streptomyces albidus (ex Kaewkla and Franco 2022)]